MRLLLASLLLVASTLAGGEEILINVEKDVSIIDLLDLISRLGPETILYLPDDLEGKTARAAQTLRVPPGRLHTALTFLLSLEDLSTRRHAGDFPLTVVLSASATANRYAVTNLGQAVQFHRPPTAWRRATDAGGTLTEESATALLKLIRSNGDPLAKRSAAVLLGFCGPRSPEIVTGLTRLLSDPASRMAAAEALGRIGHPARTAVPALEELAKGAEGAARISLQAILESLRTALHPALLNPKLADEKAPESFKVRFETGKGGFTLEVHRKWAPHGADRLYNLVRIGYFRDVAFFRVLKGFMAQFGVHGDARVNSVWRHANIPDDPVVQPNVRGMLTFAKTNRPNTRSVQFFINTSDNRRLDAAGFAPLGRVIEGMEIVDQFYSGYGEGAPSGRGPSQGRLQVDGNAYLREYFPKLDYIKSATLIE
ncbi:MAG: peptidylprolyl isomerase [Planctomycetota bacterium]|jgi:peptidyl-prolyl cis-trans isomerase A (cyclophilin A)